MVEQLLKDAVFLDLETHPDGTLLAVGAIRGESTFSHGSPSSSTRLTDLDHFCKGASALVGHNICTHDVPVIRNIQADLDLFGLPVIDTLLLSPLAFPENPYHRLVKDYKLVSASRNDPVADARLSAELLNDELESFRHMGAQNILLPAFYAHAFTRAGSPYKAMVPLFGTEAIEADLSEVEAFDLLFSVARNKVCPHSAQRITDLQPEPLFWPAVAYALAWLTVADGNSVLPPWVRHSYPLAKTLLTALRETPCGTNGCPYCDTAHNPGTQLERYFGFPDFRPLPDGRHLQHDLVLAAMQGKSLLGILPTGGGKSLCYQLPALVRYQRRGVLSVILSPLQALMKDQVDNLKDRLGTEAVGAVYGMLTPQERGAMLEAVRMGEIGMLYLSPEQLRNPSVVKVLATRDIDCWIFDEAHCLSKWGHDFRPDYLYASRFIRETHQGVTPPQITCYTATAKKEVIQELVDHFNTELGVTLALFEGGVERENLTFDIQMVVEAEKEETILGLLETHLGSPPEGSAIIYCATRRRTQTFAEALESAGWKAEAFHGALPAPEKKEVQDRFTRGETPVIAATNAFGMGIDKDNVRLVIHADIPGSLENYLQEAGRAGRDQKQAHCVLLYADKDIETQFDFNAMSELTQGDIAKILKELKVANAHKDANGEIVMTAGELLRRHNVELSFSDNAGDRGDTLVKAAISWLERAGYVERNENRTSVFNGKPVHASTMDLSHHLDRLNLPANTRRLWEAVLRIFDGTNPDEGLSADGIAEQLGAMGVVNKGAFEDSRGILALVHQMAEAGLLTKGATMTAWVTAKGLNKSKTLLDARCALEKGMLKALMEEHPEGKGEAWLPLAMTHLCRKLVADGFHEAKTPVVQSLLKSISRDGRGEKGGASLDMRHQHQSRFLIKLNREWETIATIMGRRHNLAYTLLAAITEAVGGSKAPQGALLASFTSTDLADAIRRDLNLHVEEEKMLAAMDRGLLFLHEQEVITLQKGLTVFRQAMTLRLTEAAKGRKYSKKDFEPLVSHYSQRTFQVHVMNEFARQGLTKMSRALNLVMAYFSLGKRAFIKRYFPDKEEFLALATGEASWKRIVEELHNPDQEAIVTAPADESRLVLAGPGSGKTRTIVHRCAHLVKVQRVRPQSILVLCFNHATAVELRKRLRDLVASHARGIAVMTYHALALSITGKTPEGRGDTLTQSLDGVIDEAVAMLSGGDAPEGLEADTRRERLLGGIEHILVDEYQDIDGRQYKLVAALAGKNKIDGDGRLSLFAVGDDDQAIYGFRDASVTYIKDFQSDYQAQTSHLVENYRSTTRIIDAANALIGENHARMKADLPLTVNKARQEAPKGGRWEALDPETKGHVRIVSAQSVSDQARFIATDIQRLLALDPDTTPSDIAVFSRTGMDHAPLSLVRTALNAEKLAVSLSLSGGTGFSITRTREFLSATAWLNTHKTQRFTATALSDQLTAQGLLTPEGPGVRFLIETLRDWETQTANSRQQAGHLIDFLHTAAHEDRREKRSGKGAFLSTAHGAKGLEFKHVYVLDGGWPHRPQEIEEERRLYYVAMTRAMETLTLFSLGKSENPHIVPVRKAPHMPCTAPPSPRLPDLRYQIIGMDHLFLDFAGRMIPQAPIHKALAALTVGEELSLATRKGVTGLWKDEKILARLSAEGTAHWRPLLTTLHSLTVIAMVRRSRDDVTDPSFAASLKCDTWEIPICEAVFQRA
ncbi:helicase [Desulfoluna limicola]|uniref:DNA 3'-5' helicase n=1 Tax=Desulfoluna limicola TaxID=2810562 RepID=A0ABN6F3I7_9BACT|nr:RecQ family ATP-dependent DNA helicase [Desulfoluna limicola]BCS97002.1 helicase [Desulfoluna limicola]